jgi:hypothetical protein
MAVVRDIRIGERFKATGGSLFGRAGGEVYEVGSIRVEGCVVPHAQLFNITAPLDKKFISVNALRDANLYVPVENPDLKLVDRSAE